MSDYSDSGFDSFLSRSIDTLPQSNLDSQGPNSTQMRYDSSQLSGGIGDAFKLGGIKMSGRENAITLNNGKIVVNDTNDGSTVEIGNGVSTFTDSSGNVFTTGAIGSGQMGDTIVDSTGFTLFKFDGQTWYWYDKVNNKNVMQIGKLPDGTYGFAVAKTGYDVKDTF